MQPDPQWLEATLVESAGLLNEACHEHMGVCSALGVDPDELEPGDAAVVASRIVEDLERHERLAGYLMDLLELQQVELALHRTIAQQLCAEAQGLRDLLREAMEVVGVDPASDGSPSAFVEHLHELVGDNDEETELDPETEAAE